MTLNKIASITAIEQQIAKVIAQLEKARAQQFAAAEKAFLAAQKATEVAQLKVDTLEAKASTTPAAFARLTTAQVALVAQQQKLAGANEIYSALVATQEATSQFTVNVAKVMAGKKLGKKIKFTKKEKAVIKEDKKAAKKMAKAEKKVAKETAKKNAKAATKLAKENTATEAPIITPTKPVRKASVRKAPVKKIAPPVAEEKKPVAETIAPFTQNAITNAPQTESVELNQAMPAQHEAIIETIITSDSTLTNTEVETPHPIAQV